MQPLFTDAKVVSGTPAVLTPLDLTSAQALDNSALPAVVPAPAAVTSREVAPPRVTEDQIAALGSQGANGLSSVSHQLLAQVKTSDTEGFGQGLTELVVLAKGLDPKALEKRGLVRRLLGRLAAAKEQLVAQYSTVERQMDALVVQLDQKAALHRQRIGDMEQMYSANEGYHGQLDAAAAAGERLLTQLRADFEAEKQVAVHDSFGAQRLADHQRVIARLEKRIDDLRRAMLLAKQTAPQLRLMQENARALVQKFDDIKVVTLPAWKNAFGLYVLQLEQQQGVRLTEAVDNMTDEALRASADLLRQNTESIARSRQRSVMTVETLNHIHTQLLGSVEDVQRIEREGQAARANEAPKLLAMEKALIEAFAPVKTPG